VNVAFSFSKYAQKTGPVWVSSPGSALVQSTARKLCVSAVILTYMFIIDRYALNRDQMIGFSEKFCNR